MAVRPGPGLRMTGKAPSSSIKLFWRSGSHEYDESLSADQFMNYNYMFKDASGKYASRLASVT
jgi:hypothetical protein